MVSTPVLAGVLVGAFVTLVVLVCVLVFVLFYSGVCSCPDADEHTHHNPECGVKGITLNTQVAHLTEEQRALRDRRLQSYRRWQARKRRRACRERPREAGEVASEDITSVNAMTESSHTTLASSAAFYGRGVYVEDGTEDAHSFYDEVSSVGSRSAMTSAQKRFWQFRRRPRRHRPALEDTADIFHQWAITGSDDECGTVASYPRLEETSSSLEQRLHMPHDATQLQDAPLGDEALFSLRGAVRSPVEGGRYHLEDPTASPGAGRQAPPPQRKRMTTRDVEMNVAISGFFIGTELEEMVPTLPPHVVMEGHHRASTPLASSGRNKTKITEPLTTDLEKPSAEENNNYRFTKGPY